jgi:hypothetical protein
MKPIIDRREKKPKSEFEEEIERKRKKDKT